MIASQLINELANRNVELRTEGELLRVRAPEGTLTPELRAGLASLKQDVMLLLRESQNRAETELINPDPQARFDPFPLTDIQQAYCVGRDQAFEIGNVACHVYYEVESDKLDLERLTIAWQRIIARHDMLRAVILPDLQQQVLESVPPYVICITDLCQLSEDERGRQLASIREQLSHQTRPLSQWPPFCICASRLTDTLVRLHLSFDILNIDVWSLQMILREWQQLYDRPDASFEPLDLSFRDYAIGAGSGDTSALERSANYWSSRAAAFPSAPDLPLAASPSTISEPRFFRRKSRLAAESWKRLQQRAHDHGVTPSGILLAAFAEVLSVWSKRARFAINVTTTGRKPIHPQVQQIAGSFTSFVPLEVDHTSPSSFGARAERIQAQLLDDIEHAQIGGVQIMRDIARAQGKSFFCLPVVMTSLLNHHSSAAGSSRALWMGDAVYGISQTPQVWLDHQVFEETGELVFNWDVVESLFPPGLISDMFAAYCGLLIKLAEDPAEWTNPNRQLVPEYQLQQRAAANATAAPLPELLLQDLFAKQVVERPEQIAVISWSRRLNYEQLDHLSNTLARRLRQRGASANRLIAVITEKGWQQVVAVLAVLKSGAAYLPISPETPKERLAYLIAHSEAHLALTQASLKAHLDLPESVSCLAIEDSDDDDISPEPVAAQRPQDLAYVIYTSGSTGQPKGVMINHRGAVNTILDINRRFNARPEDRILALSDLTFDLSVYDIFGALAAGGTIVMPEPAARRDPERWLELISEHGVTIWNSVPALLEMLLAFGPEKYATSLTSLRLALLSGDWIAVDLPDRFKRVAPSAEVISLGGATEASIWSILFPIDRVEQNWKSIPYGKPMANQRFHVFNEALDHCPNWTTGQLYIAGDGIACGYWRDDEQTRASFIIHPHTGERLYRTGDLGCYLPGGNIEFLGRQDSQVKIRGHRIEPGEIEAALSQHPGVQAAVVKAIGKTPERHRLVAYVVARGQAPTSGELGDFLKTKLPAYMLPATFIVIDALPLTANGKADRKGLPDPDAGAQPEYASPHLEPDDVDRLIADAVSRVLGIDDIPPQADIISLGANSIDLVRIANQLECEFGYRPALEEFYALGNVARMGRFYRQREARPQPSVARQSLVETIVGAQPTAEVLLDPREREIFKQNQSGERSINASESRITLRETRTAEAMLEMYRQRQSHRHFSTERVGFTEFSALFASLRVTAMEGNPRRLYASAGGLYPAQVYVQVKAERVENVAAGVYYYHPTDHRLILLSAEAALDRSAFDPVLNAPVFDQSAFAIFLVAQMRAITPLYGDHSLRFAIIEAGLISQLLEMTAPEQGIGLCQIGALDFERARSCFKLEESHVYLHSLLGGRLPASAQDGLDDYRQAHYSFDFTGIEEGVL